MSVSGADESRRSLIVNADDFGQSHGINQGVALAHTDGIVTSASMMVRWPAVSEAVVWARARSGFSLGLHLDLGEWRYDVATFSWVPVYEVVPLDNAELVYAEVRAQCDRFVELVGRGPTHLDSHQHVHLREPIRAIVLEEAARLGAPVRSAASPACYSGAFYGQSSEGWPVPAAIQPEALIALLEKLPPGLTELGCHPATEVDFTTMYRDERMQELSTLTDPAVQAAARRLGIKLVPFPEPNRTVTA